jgi:hypothetical protein
VIPRPSGVTYGNKITTLAFVADVSEATFSKVNHVEVQYKDYGADVVLIKRKYKKLGVKAMECAGLIGWLSSLSAGMSSGQMLICSSIQ